MTRAHTHIMLSSAVLLFAAGCASSRPTCTSCACIAPPGAPTAVSATTADALREVLMDERRAQAFYTGVMAKHGQARPFTNIVKAEERHAAVIEALMTRHGVAIPADTPMNLPAVPPTIAGCSRLAAQLERENIAMYDRLLGAVPEADIQTAFVNLRHASKDNHLPAFERWSASSAAPASGRGPGFGLGRGPGGPSR